MKYVLDADGRPQPEPDLMTWARWFETAERHIAKESPIPGVTVSTVFLGVDHQLADGPPLLWETMIFRAGRGEEMWRYASRAEAEAGHRRAVELVIEGEG